MVKSSKISARNIFSHGLFIPVFLAFFQLWLQTVFHENYGYFRDELYYIACSNHLAFGYVDQPPLSIAILWLNRLILGDSLHALRFLPGLSGALVVLLAALMARRLGGSIFAQGLAALSVVAAHGLIGHGKYFSMNPFDVFFWALAGYVVIELLAGDKPKLWILFGLVVGLGLMNKYSMGFMVIGLVAGLLLTRQRKQMTTIWFWLGGAVAAVIFLPHIIWQVTHGFPSLEFMRNASQNKNASLGLVDFLMGQIRDINIFNAPLWLGGIYFFFKAQKGRLRPLGWMYIVGFCSHGRWECQSLLPVSHLSHLPRSRCCAPRASYAEQISTPLVQTRLCISACSGSAYYSPLRTASSTG
jgi:4-amino-4-deoxy-L-arabinose transferase-like glycosyltransferase